MYIRTYNRPPAAELSGLKHVEGIVHFVDFSGSAILYVW
jgi:hypothetical protein